MIRVNEWMTSPVATIKPRDSVLAARDAMERRRINQLPVVVRGKIVGIVTDRDLRDAFPSVLNIPGRRRRRQRPVAELRDVPVEEVMTRNVLTLSPERTILEAARVMRRERVGALPIVDRGKLVGILTRSDLLDACAGLVEEIRKLAGASADVLAERPEEMQDGG